jgi:hypothetical protein
MPHAQPLDAANRIKLEKIWAMRGSAHAGERRNAEALAARLVHRFGYTVADVPALLRGEKPAQPDTKQHQTSGQTSGFAANNMNDSARARARAEQEQKRHRAQAPERAEVLRRYGGLEAVVAWTERERLLRAAVARWSKFHDWPLPGWTKSIDGYQHGIGKVSERVLRALSEAYPLPTTISAAAAEFAMWQRRQRDLMLVVENDLLESYLDMPAALRRDIVAALLQTGLRATAVSELVLRYRHMLDADFQMPEVEQAILTDLEHLAALEETAGVQNGRAAPASDRPTRTARERSAEVRRLLSNMDTARLSDREIARRVGVSPQTVGNIRRRM